MCPHEFGTLALNDYELVTFKCSLKKLRWSERKKQSAAGSNKNELSATLEFFLAND